MEAYECSACHIRFPKLVILHEHVRSLPDAPHASLLRAFEIAYPAAARKQTGKIGTKPETHQSVSNNYSSQVNSAPTFDCPVCGRSLNTHGGLMDHITAKAKIDTTGLHQSLLEDWTRGVAYGTSRHEPEELKESLDTQLLRFIEAGKVAEDVVRRRQEVLNLLKGVVLQIFNGKVGLELFGSCATRLATDTSDLDLCVTIHTGQSDGLKESQHLEVLQKLYYAIQSLCRGEPTLILSARVPIVKWKDSLTSIECDFTLRIGRHDLKTKFLRIFVDGDARFRPFVLLVKHWSKQRYVGDATRGTLNSFGHTLLVVHFLQALDPPMLPIVRLRRSHNAEGALLEQWTIKPFTRRNTMSFGELLFAYFDYFANRFDFERHIVTTRFEKLIPASAEERALQFQKRQRTSFCVEDPLDLTDNVGRNVNRDAACYIAEEFDRGYRILKQQGSYMELCRPPSMVPMFRGQHRISPQTDSGSFGLSSVDASPSYT